MLRLISSFLFLVGAAGAAWWVWNSNPTIRNFVQEHLETGKFATLEARYNADQIMELHRKDLIKNDQYSFLEPSLKFYPYAMMEVKYSLNAASTAEGIILWSLDDGEMVLDTATWTTTHGLQDCINRRADKSDYKLINALSRTGGAADRQKLLSLLHVENEILDSIVESCRRKKLIVQSGNQYRLHFQKPNFQITPETKLDQWLVTKPYRDATRVPPRYTLSQVEEASNQLFGNDFSIRNITEIYLPVYNLTVQNPDGSCLTTSWNALNGKRFHHPFFPER